jgi:hypothetical protein
VNSNSFNIYIYIEMDGRKYPKMRRTEEIFEECSWTCGSPRTQKKKKKKKKKKSYKTAERGS